MFSSRQSSSTVTAGVQLPACVASCARCIFSAAMSWGEDSSIGIRECATASAMPGCTPACLAEQLAATTCWVWPCCAYTASIRSVWLYPSASSGRYGRCTASHKWSGRMAKGACACSGKPERTSDAPGPMPWRCQALSNTCLGACVISQFPAEQQAAGGAARAGPHAVHHHGI